VWYSGLGLVARDLRLNSQLADDQPVHRPGWGTPLAVAAVLSVPIVELREMFVRDTPAAMVTYRSLLSVATTLILFALFILRSKAQRQVESSQVAMAATGPGSAQL
jgi:hypothetical protein